MALTDDIRSLLGFGDGPETNAEINLKIKPLGSVSAAPAPSDPTTVGATGGDASGGATLGTLGSSPSAGTGTLPLGGGIGTTPDANRTLLGFGPGGQSVVDPSQRLRNTNPNLIKHPLGAQTDDIYEAAVAQLAFDTQRQHAQLLQELGFVDAEGNFMPGTLETEAVRQRSELERQRQLTLEEVIGNAVRGGTVFSGRRAKLQSDAQQPFDAAISELTTRLSRELASRFQGISGLNQQFEIGRNMLLAEAAERIKAALMGGPVGGDSADPGATGDVPPATAPPSGLSLRLPPGYRVQYDPQRGQVVVDQNGTPRGYIGVDGLYYSYLENSGPTAYTPPRATSSGGGSRTSVAQ